MVSVPSFTVPGSTLPIATSKALWAFIIAQLAFGAIAATTSWVVAVVPVLVVIGVSAALWPRIGILFLAASTFLRIDLPGLVGVYPGDIIALLLVAGLALHLVLHGPQRIFKNALFAPLAVMLGIFAISLLDAFDPELGLKNWFRHLQMVFVILVVSVTVEASDIRRIIKLILWMAIGLSIPNIIEAIRLGGTERVFGIGSLFLPFYLATGIMYCTIEYLLSERRWIRSFMVFASGIMGVAIIATQTREAMLHTAIGVSLSCWLIWRWAIRTQAPTIKRRVLTVVVYCVIAASLFMFGSITVFEAPANRIVQAVEGRSNTIFIRLFLWKMGVHVFLDSPVLGIGLGQNSEWDKFIPLWHFDPMSRVSRGLGVHNDLITYAAETGILGLMTLFWFFVRMMKSGWRAYHSGLDRTELQLLLIVWVPCLAVFARFFYGTHTFYSLGGLFNCLYFGMLIACVRELGHQGVKDPASA